MAMSPTGNHLHHICHALHRLSDVACLFFWINTPSILFQDIQMAEDLYRDHFLTHPIAPKAWDNSNSSLLSSYLFQHLCSTRCGMLVKKYGPYPLGRLDFSASISFRTCSKDLHSSMGSTFLRKIFSYNSRSRMIFMVSAKPLPFPSSLEES